MDEKRAPGGAIIRRHGKVQVTGRKINMSCYFPENIVSALQEVAELLETDVSALVRSAIRNLTEDDVEKNTPPTLKRILVRIDPEDYDRLTEIQEKTAQVPGRRGEHVRKKTELVRLAVETEIKKRLYKYVTGNNQSSTHDTDTDFSFLQ